MQTSVGVIGGTGAEGSGLALRLARAGMRVLLGSRDLEKAQREAGRLVAAAGAGEVTGHTNPDTAAGAGALSVITAVWAPVDRVTRSAESRSFGGAKPVA